MAYEEKNSLFPLILGNLVNKPLNCDTESNLLKDIQMHLKSEGIQTNHLEEQFKEAVDIGMDLGILRFEGNALRMPRIYKMDEMVAPSTSRKRERTNRQASEASRRRAPNRSSSRRRRRSRSGSPAHSRRNSRNKRKSR